MKKTTIIIILAVVVLAALGFYFFYKTSPDIIKTQNEEEPIGTTTNEGNTGVVSGPKSVIGKSVEGRDIEAYTYGTGSNHLLFVGGIHGGYSWNTASVAYELIDYLEEGTSTLPANLKVTVIPVLNPDGLNKVIGTTGRFAKADVPTSEELRVAGRFNANKVDLNRNFDCDWRTDATWQDKAVSGGSKAFSEPEAMAFKNYIETNNPDAVVVWYSAVGGVFASNCHEGVLPETLEITNVFANASGYKAYGEFNFYEITGDMVNWLAKIKVPATSVLLTTHEDIEWEKNLKGIQALFAHYSSAN